MSSINNDTPILTDVNSLSHHDRFHMGEQIVKEICAPYMPYEPITTLEKVKSACLFAIPIFGLIAFSKMSKPPKYNQNLAKIEILTSNVNHFKALNEKSHIYMITQIAIACILIFGLLLPPASPIFLTAACLFSTYFITILGGKIKIEFNEYERKLHYAYDTYFIDQQLYLKSLRRLGETPRETPRETQG